MAAIFPASLPWFTRFVLSPAGQRAATKPPKHVQQRANTTSGWAMAEVSWVFFEEQRATFETWFRDDLNRGASWALMKLPITPGGIAGDCYSAVRFPAGYSKTLVVNGLWRVSAQIVIRDRFECAVPSYRVDLHCENNAGGSSAVGVVLSGLSASKTYRLTLTAGGWSRHDLDADNGGLTWFHEFRVTHAGGEEVIGSATAYATAAAALAAFVPETITGYTSYTFWLFDNVLGDNRGGLSILIEQV
jgi:hypothetical protein